MTTDQTTDQAAEIAAAEAALQAAEAEVARLRAKLSEELAEARTQAAEEGRVAARRRHPGKESAASAATTYDPDGVTNAGINDGCSSKAADGIAGARSRAGKRPSA